MRIRNLLGGPLAIHNRKMVDGKYESVDEYDMFNLLLSPGEETWVPEEWLGRPQFKQALGKKMLVVVTFEMLQGRFRFLDVEEEIGG